MLRIALLLIALLFFSAVIPCVEAAVFPDSEYLSYDVTWPSGLSLGQTSLQAKKTSMGWEFNMIVQASLPILEIQDEYYANADSSLCSKEFSKDARHGEQRVQEKTEFNQKNLKAIRRTLNGGESTFSTPPCARDGLTFLYFLREQLAAGRIPPPDDIYFGAQYQVSVTYLESRDIEIGTNLHPADRILVNVNGPKSELSFEIYFGKNRERTPLLILVPFEVGTFSLRLVQ